MLVACRLFESGFGLWKVAFGSGNVIVVGCARNQLCVRRSVLCLVVWCVQVAAALLFLNRRIWVFDKRRVGVLCLVGVCLLESKSGNLVVDMWHFRCVQCVCVGLEAIHISCLDMRHVFFFFIVVVHETETCTVSLFARFLFCWICARRRVS